MGERERLLATFDGVMQVRRQSILSGEARETIIYDNQPCALSRAAHTAAPSPPLQGAHIGESQYRMTLFMPPEIMVNAGDKVQVTQGGWVFECIASDTFCYISHGVCVVSVIRGVRG